MTGATFDHRGWAPFVEAVRPVQWLKNILVFVPAIAGHVLVTEIPDLLLAFLAFSLCASSAYVTNDLLDRAGDRDHPRKRHRPFAAGALSRTQGVAMSVALLVVAFAIATRLPHAFSWALAAYFAATTAYSIYFKRKPILDVLTLACLYCARLEAGSVATSTALSPWLMALAMFLFLSLALVKRCAEISSRAQAGKNDDPARGYRQTDLPLLEALAVAAAYNSVLVLALYTNLAPERLAYAHPERLWILCPLLLAWLSRVLLLTHRGEMNDDPLIFATRDRWGLLIGSACVVSVAAASV